MNISIFAETERLASDLAPFLVLPLYDETPRIIVSGIACSLAMEHWTATVALLQEGLLPSAAVVHRSQFEALLRSVWALYAASDEHLLKLAEPLTLEAEQGAKNLPQTADMMSAVGKKGPSAAYDALSRFKDNSWKALNSYAHAGIHAIKRHVEGHPQRLIADLVRNANGLAVVGAMQAVVLGGMQPLQKEVLAIAKRYPQSMPPPL